MESKTKKDVLVYNRHPRRVTVIPFWTRGIYRYTVDGNEYQKRYSLAAKKKEMPWSVEIVYLKGHPRICYVKNITSDPSWEIYAIAFFGMAVVSLVCFLGITLP